MRFKINDTEYKVYFRHTNVPQTIRAVHHKHNLKQTIVSEGTIFMTEVFVYNVTHDLIFMESMSECEIFDKYDKRLGMNLAIKNLLKELNVSSTKDVTVISEYIKETWFNFKKNVQYKYLIQK